MLSAVRLKMELIVKSEKYDGVSTRENITELIKNKLSSKFTVSSTNLNLVVKVPIGNNEIEVTIIPMHDVEDENMRFESLECRITASCRFSKFSDRVGNFREAQRKIEHVLKDTEVPRFKEEMSLICKLKSLNEITGILKNTNFELLSAELDNGKQFELTKDKIIIYDKDINDEMISLAKKMIVMYD